MTFTGTSVLMGIVIWCKYCIHRGVSAAGPCTCLPSHIQKTTRHFRHWNRSYPWVKGWGGVFGSDRWSCLSQSLHQYLTAPSARPSSADASSTGHLMMETDPVLITRSFFVLTHSLMHKSRNQHSMWRLHLIRVRTMTVTQPICSRKYNKNCKIITEILWKTLHEVTVFHPLYMCLTVQHTNLHAPTLPACSPVRTHGDVKSTCLISARQ